MMFFVKAGGTREIEKYHGEDKGTRLEKREEKTKT